MSSVSTSSLPSTPSTHHSKANEPPFFLAIRAIAEKCFQLEELNEQRLKSFYQSRLEADNDRLKPYSQVIIATSRQTLIAIKEGEETGFIYSVKQRKIKNCSRHQITYFVTQSSAPFYRKTERVVAISATAIPYARLSQIAECERIFSNLVQEKPQSAALSQYLDQRKMAFVGNSSDVAQTKAFDLWAAAADAWLALSRLHKKNILWHAWTPEKASQVEAGRFLFSFEDCCEMKDFGPPSFEHDQSLLYYQPMLSLSSAVSQEHFKRVADRARFAFALLNHLVPNVAALFGKSVVIQKRTDAIDFHAYVSHVSPKAMDQLDALSEEQRGFTQELLQYFPPPPSALSSTLPKEAAYAFSLLPTDSVMAQIFHQKITSKCAISYHSLPEGLFSCEQTFITQGTSMALWRQRYNRLGEGASSSTSMEHYHLIAVGSDEEVKVRFKVHAAIAKLGISGIHSAGKLISENDLTSQKGVNAHFQHFTPYMKEAILTDYAPLGSCENSTAFQAFSITEKERMLTDLAKTLEHLHYCCVLHRDVKPDNILLVDSQLRFTDFGASGTWSKIVARDRKIALVFDAAYGTCAYRFSTAESRWHNAHSADQRAQVGMELDWEAFALTELELLFGENTLLSWVETKANSRKGYPLIKQHMKASFLSELRQALKEQGFSQSYSETLLNRCSVLPAAAIDSSS